MQTGLILDAWSLDAAVLPSVEGVQLSVRKPSRCLCVALTSRRPLGASGCACLRGHAAGATCTSVLFHFPAKPPKTRLLSFFIASGGGQGGANVTLTRTHNCTPVVCILCVVYRKYSGGQLNDAISLAALKSHQPSTYTKEDDITQGRKWQRDVAQELAVLRWTVELLGGRMGPSAWAPGGRGHCGKGAWGGLYGW